MAIGIAAAWIPTGQCASQPLKRHTTAFSSIAMRNSPYLAAAVYYPEVAFVAADLRGDCKLFIYGGGDVAAHVVDSGHALYSEAPALAVCTTLSCA